ncbi:FtsX-like permease family protein [Catellatospora vulcania]|uniref:FtsX-like permease family protein n=1 Tax=Catellatospora vulcania TaxID=1460450 RepID=UPI0012D39DD5|nr:FtsX-like permease family protein [Catellatospora vulcania]
MLARRRAYSAKGLLTAAAAAALISTTLLVGLASYSGAVIEAGARAAVAAAPPDERAVQVRLPSRTGGSGWSTSSGEVDKSFSAQSWAETDRKLRESFADRFSGTDLAVDSAGYASGLKFTSDTGDAAPDSYGVVYARVMFLEELAEHARLVSGSWPVAGSNPPQVVVGEAAAQALGLKVGSEVVFANGITKKEQRVTVSGVFAAQHADDPYWLLVPEMAEGVEAGRSTYGPLVLPREDFFNGWSYLGNSGWVVTPDLSRAELSQLVAARSAVQTLPEVTEELGYGEGGQAGTHLERLVDRIQQASLVGRSDLLTPMLLISILGGYALLLLAALLTEGRRAETALLRARGASRGQLAGLAAREALLIAGPAAVLAPLLVAPLLGLVERLPALSAVSLRLEAGITPTTVAVAVAAGLGCVLAILLPALRGGGTYVADLAARSRPSRAAAAQRTGLDLALIGFAGLAWFQLQQYDSPLSGVAGQLGIDPLLAAAGPLGVLAGAVLALRLLPPLTRLLERRVDRRPWFAAQLGVWQAGRRPHAGPVLLLALSVAVSTLAWTLAATARQSQVDQADHSVGADLRLVETAWSVPPARVDQIAALPGITAALPAWRTRMDTGEKATPTTILALDTKDAGGVLRLRSDLGDAPTLLAAAAADSRRQPGVDLPEGTTAVRGTLRISDPGGEWLDRPRDVTALVLTDLHGAIHQVSLAGGEGADARTFEVSVPHSPGLRLTGFAVDGPSMPGGVPIVWQLDGLTAVGSGGTAAPLNLDGGDAAWGLPTSKMDTKVRVEGNSLRLQLINLGGFDDVPRYAFNLRLGSAPPTVPALATPELLASLHTQVGATLAIPLWGTTVSVHIVGQLAALPGGVDPAALLVDMPSLSAHFQQAGWRPPNLTEWWVQTDPARHTEAAAAAAPLPNLQTIDRKALAVHAADDPFGVGARIALFIAAFGAIALALVGVAVDVRATARRRVAELAVLNTLGATSRLLARALMIEQAFLAGLGVAVGLVVGMLVARTTGSLVILTPSASRPVPPALTTTDWLPVLGTAAALLALTLVMAGLVATSMRQRLAAAQLRIGADR